MIGSEKGLMLKTLTLWRQIYIITSVDETKLSCNTPPLPPTPTPPPDAAPVSLKTYNLTHLSVYLSLLCALRYNTVGKFDGH